MVKQTLNYLQFKLLYGYKRNKVVHKDIRDIELKERKFNTYVYYIELLNYLLTLEKVKENLKLIEEIRAIIKLINRLAINNKLKVLVNLGDLKVINNHIKNRRPDLGFYHLFNWRKVSNFNRCQQVQRLIKKEFNRFG
jgi:hypothetical protein